MKASEACVRVARLPSTALCAPSPGRALAHSGSHFRFYQPETGSGFCCFFYISLTISEVGHLFFCIEYIGLLYFFFCELPVHFFDSFFLLGDFLLLMNFYNIFIKIFTFTVHPFKRYSSVAFSIFRIVQPAPYLISEHFHSAKRKCTTH